MLSWDCYDCYYGWCHGIAMVGAMGLLWLISWDYYRWYHEIAMVAAMITTMVATMVATMIATMG